MGGWDTHLRKDRWRRPLKGVMFGQRLESSRAEDSVLGRGKCKNHKVGANIECLTSSRKTKVVVMECTERRKGEEEAGHRQAQSAQGLTGKEFGSALREMAG